MGSFIVTSEKLLYGGDALARRDDGKAVFIPYAVPGERLLVRACAERKNYIRAEILEILTPGDGRIKPTCPHFGKCGGCCWQHVEYYRQVEAKRRILEELFNHRFPETGPLTITMLPCSRPFGYRSRARVQLRTANQLRITDYELRGDKPYAQRPGDDRGGLHPERLQGSAPAVGFFRGGSHIVEDIECCPLFRPCLNGALQALRQISCEQFYNDVREIDIAGSEEDDKWAMAKCGNESEHALLRRKVGNFTYNTTAGAFFQANDFITDALVTHVMDQVSQNSGAALDLFSGVGLFSLPLTQRFRAVTAVEYSRESHGLCVMNAAQAGIENLEIVCADVAKWLNSQNNSRFDCVVLDPPRTGVGPGVMEHAVRLACKEIIYVSCDPQTLVRDLERLDMDSWRIVSVVGFDMFPQTYHFETVVHLCKLN